MGVAAISGNARCAQEKTGGRANRPDRRTAARAARAVRPIDDDEERVVNNKTSDRCGAFTSSRLTAPTSAEPQPVPVLAVDAHPARQVVKRPAIRLDGAAGSSIPAC